MTEKASLDCPVCMDQYDEGLRTPKMMPCLHTICAGCILTLLYGVNEDQGIYMALEPTEPLAARPQPTSRPSFLRQSSQPNLADQRHIYEDMNFLEGQGRANQPSRISRGRGNPAIAAFANLMQNNRGHPALRRLSGHGPVSVNMRRPHDALPPVPDSDPPPLPERSPVTKAPGRPKSGPPVPSNPPSVLPKKEPHIPKDRVVQCPICRSQVNTTKLQTNRYVLAHMKDLERLKSAPPPSESNKTPRPTEAPPQPPPNPPPDPSQDSAPASFWCADCSKVAQDSCVSHKLMSIAQWVESQQASLKNLRQSVELQLTEHFSSLQGIEEDIKSIFQSLSKASRHLCSVRKEAEAVRTALNSQQVIPASAPPLEKAKMLQEQLAGTVSLQQRVVELEEGTNNSEVYIYRQNGKLYVSTSQPDRTIIINITDGHTSV